MFVQLLTVAVGFGVGYNSFGILGGLLAGTGVVFYSLRAKKSGVTQQPLEKPLKDTYVAYKKGEKFSSSEPNCEIPARRAKEGVGSVQPTTVMSNFAIVAKRKGDRIALRVCRENKYVEWTWREYYEESLRCARALMHLGLQPFEAVNIIGFNSPEWFIGNMGAIAAGGKAAGIYTTNMPDACKFITEHSGARIVIVEDEKQLDKFLQIRDDLPKLTAIVVYAPGALSEAKKKEANVHGKVPVYDWATFMALGDKVSERDLAERIENQRPGHPCTLIYTSGTTGNPKAVMITHDNVTWTSQSLMEILPDGFGTDPNEPEAIVSYLPLSHIAAQMLDIHVPIVASALLPGTVTITFAMPDALRGTLAVTLRDARPTVFFGVPRVWQKMAEKLQQIGAKTTGLKKTLSTWAKKTALQVYENHLVGGSYETAFGFSVADLLLGKVRQALGLDRCRMMFTGAAPIHIDTLRYFGSLGITIFELYGMSECTGPQTVNYIGCNKLGSVGRALPGCELKIDHDPDRGDALGEGEICYRGRHIMAGYMNAPEKTKEAIDADGWLHSGDVGRVDDDGFCYITGRIKELIITAGGENIAPVPMENRVKEKCPGIKDIAMQGDHRKYNVCLVSLHCEEKPDGTFTDKLVDPTLSIASKAKTVSEAKNDPAILAHIQAGLDYANEHAVSNASKIQKFAIIDSPFSAANNELTPTLKVKRKVVSAKYKDLIDSLYA